MPPTSAANKLFSHCNKCGSPYAPGAEFPKTCPSCAHIVYPTPPHVSVGLIPCEDGLLGVFRGIEPFKGSLALPGGFGGIESPEQACSREALEETGVEIDPSAWRYQSSFVTPNGNVLQFFAADIEPIAMPSFPFDPPPGVRQETEGFAVIRHGSKLAFPSHEAAAEAWLARRAPKR